jgi:HAD superfamily hydrolase (TIGR01509 family)
MQWIFQYQLFLFDFDGLLVDTEQLHYQAYINMCAEYGYNLAWTFKRYSEAAHHESTGLRDQIYEEFPNLQAEKPNWHVLYETKKRIFLSLLESGDVPLMAGVEELLMELDRNRIPRCVVTNSNRSLIDKICKQNPILDTIPHWIVREDYGTPKPDPECYRTAISRFEKPGDSVIGFEDSPKGLKSLLGTSAQPVLVCPPDYPYIKPALQLDPRILYFPSLSAIHSG